MRALFVAGFVMIASLCNAQGLAADKVAAALAKGDARALSGYLVPTVDLSILDDEDMLPRDQVVLKLERFFKAHPVKNFEVKHKGKSKLDDHYRIGDLVTTKGTFRVTYFLKKGKEGMKVKQLRIESY